MNHANSRLSARELAVSRGGRSIFSQISFAVASTELLAVTGANGAGKSTLLRAVAGLLPIASGTIRFDDARNSDATTSESAHYFGHLDGLKPALSVFDNLALWTRIAGKPGLSTLEALEKVELDHLDDLPAGYLSAGQRRRASLARLLVVRRPIWLLDEPTSALDARSEETFGALLAEHLAEGGLALAATHRPLPVASTATLALGAA
ncbi:heme ABC exporter ATP-binding protein CcmA [Kaistia terrae]|uniref:Heme ABC exporter ATP-binding protein CcmA n=1 Tax=Kaistia terrae TaxID=537017 RepID=A0ABW0Q3K3_9HYPH|nr:heme ABC exporter ATP-binding protein CcmA [Kaistia terrae]MCX5581108.1 heme ABC exporter ATP-binding protein CcmA [Kaistia terrae]